VKKIFLENVLLIGVTVAAVLIIVTVVWAHYGSSEPTVCVSLPKEVALWGVNVHDTGGGLYLCFQQGAEGDRTETSCVPMTKEKCK